MKEPEMLTDLIVEMKWDGGLRTMESKVYKWGEQCSCGGAQAILWRTIGDMIADAHMDKKQMSALVITTKVV